MNTRRDFPYLSPGRPIVGKSSIHTWGPEFMTDIDRDDRPQIMALAPIAPDEDAVRQLVELAGEKEVQSASPSSEAASPEGD
jgi:hypothetical protein